jgi:hypothetical protein
MQNITFITNMGRDNLDYTKLLLNSLKVNLDNKNHEILVLVDADNENSLEYLLSIQSEFNDLKIIHNTLPLPIWYQRNKTILTQHAKYDIVSYLQSDMVIGPHYDTEILKHARPNRILSATRIEPPLHGESPITVTKNLGLHPLEFDMDTWNHFSNSIKRNELVNYFFAPFTYYKEDWMRLDGYDTTFRRSREDSDLVQRCLHAGIELVQTFSANVYHFTCVTSRGNNWFDSSNKVARERVLLQQSADAIELKRFIRKWGGFNHGEEKLSKLDIDLVVKNYTDLRIIEQIEPFFTRVWLERHEDKAALIQRYDEYHSIANTLLHITDDTWESYKHLYKTERFNDIFNVGTPETFSIKITLDFNESIDTFFSAVGNLTDAFVNASAGTYEFAGTEVIINEIKSNIPSISANNPPFDYSVLTVY